MPNTHAPEICEWVEKLSQEIKVLNEEVFFVGHSIGCQAILRYLEKQEIKKIGGLLLITPWCELLPKALETEEDKKIAKPWLTIPIDFEKIKKFTNNITCIFSNNDYFVPLSQKDFFEEKLNANSLVVKNKGHISEEEHIKYLDEILISASKMLGL